MRHAQPVAILLLALLTAPVLAQLDDAGVTVMSPRVSDHEQGKRFEQDVVLATSIAGYTLRYDVVDLTDDPGRVTFQKWAPQAGGDTPLGIVSPSMCNWYNQGFMRWSFDGFNIHDYRAKFRVIRDFGNSAMVEWVWDTPKVKVTMRWAMTSRSDKLLLFASYEPKEEIKEVTIRLTAYPATFSKPWHREATTALRSLSTGSAQLDHSA